MLAPSTPSPSPRLSRNVTMGGAIVPSLSGASIASPCIHTVCSRPRPCRRGCLETPKATAGILHGPGSRGALSMRSLPARLPLSCRAYKRGEGPIPCCLPAVSQGPVLL